MVSDHLCYHRVVFVDSDLLLSMLWDVHVVVFLIGISYQPTVHIDSKWVAKHACIHDKEYIHTLTKIDQKACKDNC